MATRLPVAFLLLFLSIPATAAQDKPDGMIVEDVACPANPISTYEQYVQRVQKQYADQVEAAKKEGFTITVPANIADTLPDRKWFERARAYEGFECHHIKYLSDGLKVSGYLWKPKDTSGAPRPLIIFNRGGNREFSAVTPWLWSGFFAYLEKGYVVVASQYRGNDGGEGREEFGGAEVHDVLNLIPLAKSLGYVDMSNVFMLGYSRGGMETYLALKQGVNVNAAAVVSGLADMLSGIKERPEMARVHKELIPDYDKRPEEVMRERSAVAWADRINVPLLILHGTADWRSDPSTQALALAQKLQERHKTYELVMYSGDNHGLTTNKLDSDRRILEWFKRYMRSR